MRGDFHYWLPFLKKDVPAELTSPVQVARFELDQALPIVAPDVTVELLPDGTASEAFTVSREGNAVTISGGDIGVLYGAYRVLMALHCGEKLPANHTQQPKYALRMINCWDNADGDIERGYSGRSLFFDDGMFDYEPERLRGMARMMASVGLNVLCINNVNVRNPAHRLIEDWLPELAEVAAIFRPFGVKLMVSIDYSQPMRHGVPTADPLDERVQAWWNEQCKLVYAAVPDLVGFLVKADSEHRPGPFTYGRNHADGANMLARALKPHGGKLVWRCFVYNCQQDWRDQVTDRPMAPYQHYVYLDGQFEDNVILQIKNGPFDFQVREPISPTLLAMPKTQLAIEWQLAQEYTGHQIDIYAMMGMWQEVMADLGSDTVMAMAAVNNWGDDDCVYGHPFAAVNTFGYGLLCWNPDDADPEAIARTWAKLTYNFDKADEDTLVNILLESRGAYEKYTSPLGLCWMVTPHVHYGASPDGYEYQAWGTYHRATRDAVGIDRTKTGTGYAEQYPPHLRDRYSNLDTCPDELKLWFHRLRYDYVMADGRTLIQRIYDDHFEGYDWVVAAEQKLAALPFPEADKALIMERMSRQKKNAHEWCDIVNSFFYRFSGVEDAKGRELYI